jgi:hypothetical protein
MDLMDSVDETFRQRYTITSHVSQSTTYLASRNIMSIQTNVINQVIELGNIGTCIVTPVYNGLYTEKMKEARTNKEGRVWFLIKCKVPEKRTFDVFVRKGLLLEFIKKETYTFRPTEVVSFHTLLRIQELGKEVFQSTLVGVMTAINSCTFDGNDLYMDLTIRNCQEKKYDTYLYRYDGPIVIHSSSIASLANVDPTGYGIIVDPEQEQCIERSRNGDTYRGTWYFNSKQDSGVMIYANGDTYRGHWVDNQRTDDLRVTLTVSDKSHGIIEFTIEDEEEEA